MKYVVVFREFHVQDTAIHTQRIEGVPGPLRFVGEDLRDANNRVIAQLHDDNNWYVNRKYGDPVRPWYEVIVGVEDESV